MNFELFISLRYLKARRKQIFISVITLIAIAGVALGVAALLVTLSVMNGFQTDLREKILGVNAHVVIFSQKGFDQEHEKKIERALQNIEEITSVAPFTYNQVMVKSASASQGIILKGVEPERTLEVTSLKKYLVAGSWDGLFSPAGKGIVLGRELSRRLGVWIGKELFLISPVIKMGAVPRLTQVTVQGIFESGMYDYDSTLAYVNIDFSREMFKGVGGVEIKVKNIYRARSLAELLRTKIKGPFVIRSWDQTHRNLFTALKLEKTIMFIILILIVLSLIHI